jgi:hypothetical protein
MGVPHFAAKFFAGLAQLALDVLPGAAEVFPSLPSRTAKVFMCPPDFVLGSPDFRTVAIPVVVAAAGGGQPKKNGDDTESLHKSLALISYVGRGRLVRSFFEEYGHQPDQAGQGHQNHPPAQGRCQGCSV